MSRPRSAPSSSSHRARRAAAVALAWLCCLGGQAATAQTLVTDKGDYSPGETVYFAATGFQPGELASIALRVENYTDTVLDYAVGGVVVDANGDFTATWIVPQEALDTLITATAIGLDSGRVAMTRFTDSSASNAFWTITATGTTVTVQYSTPVASPGIYFDRSSVVANLSVAGMPPIALPLSYISGGFAGECCGPDAYGGPSAAFYEGSTTFPPGTTVTVTSINVVQYLGINLDPVNNPGGGNCFGGSSTTRTGPPTTVTTDGSVNCPTNSAPTLDLTNVDFGQVVGCLSNGTLSADVTVAETDFAPSAFDPDGDPVNIVFNGPANFTFTGPGIATAQVTFTATDDPSARNVAGCPALVPEVVTGTAQVSIHVVYDFDGPLAPLGPGETFLKKVGRVIPMKFVLRDCNGVEVGPANSTLLDDLSERPSLDVTAVTMLAPGGSPAPADPGASNDNGTQFRYDGTTTVDGKWIYNLSTSGPGWTAGVLYRVDVSLNDGTVRPIFFSLKK